MNKQKLVLAAAILLAHQQWLYAQSTEAADAELPAGDAAVDAEEAGREPPAADGIEEIVTMGQFIPNEKRATASVSNVLDADALITAGDSNLAEGLKRVTVQM